MLRELLAELSGMFLGDARLSLAVLALVGIAALLVDVVPLDPMVGGSVLLLGCAALLIHNVRRSSRGD